MKIFVSYSRRDAGDFAEQVQRHLTSFKYDVFTDVNSIGVGDIWGDTIEDNISNCDIFVIIVTSGSLQSPHVENELLQAQRQKKRIIPCLHRRVRQGDIKWGLGRIQGVEFSDKYDLARDLYFNIVQNQEYSGKGKSTEEKDPNDLILDAAENLKRGDYDSAIAYLDKALKINPRFAVAYNIKGQALLNLRQYHDALMCYEKALQLRPKYIEAINNRGLALALMGDYNKAIECFNQSTTLNPNDATIWNHKGSAFHALGKYDDAIESFDEALRLRPTYTEALNNKELSSNQLKKKTLQQEQQQEGATDRSGDSIHDTKIKKDFTDDQTDSESAEPIGTHFGTVPASSSTPGPKEKEHIPSDIPKLKGAMPSSNTSAYTTPEQDRHFSTLKGKKPSQRNKLKILIPILAVAIISSILAFTFFGLLHHQVQYSLVRVWGSAGTGDGQFHFPSSTAVDSSGNVYVADYGNFRIQKFDSNGNFITKWGSNGIGDGQFNSPSGVSFDSSGYLYVADTGNDRVQKFDSNGNFITKWGSEGNADGQFHFPSSTAVDSSGNVYVADYGNFRIQKFDSNGNFITKWGSNGTGDGQFNSPSGVAVDSSRYVYVADTFSHRIQKFDSNGNFITKWGSNGNADGVHPISFEDFAAVAVDSSGYVYVTDENHRIQKFDSNGNFITKWGWYGDAWGQFSHPSGVSFDSSGYVYVADTGNDRVQVFAPQK